MEEIRSKETILKNALSARNASVLEYQINIDNYRLAIAEIEANHMNDPDMVEFRERLNSLLLDCLREQKKEIIIRDVIKKQLERE